MNVTENVSQCKNVAPKQMLRSKLGQGKRQGKGAVPGE